MVCRAEVEVVPRIDQGGDAGRVRFHLTETLQADGHPDEDLIRQDRDVPVSESDGRALP